MKKLLVLILTFLMATSMVACGDEKIGGADAPTDIVVTDGEEILTPPENEAEIDEEVSSTPESQTSSTPSIKPESKPSEKPETTPEKTPEPTPTPQTPKTLGNTLLSDFKAKASAGKNIQEIAEGLLVNPAIKFSGGAMSVEEGYLSGFDNTEIKGFKSAVMFAPMIGSIPFIGYIFELENEADVSSFISTLKKNANLRWNICVEAEEIITGSAGNKVFFVMCPKSLEE